MSSQGDRIENSPRRTWCESPLRVGRLLDWFDQNEDGRNIIFSKTPAGPQLGGKAKSKPYWFKEAANAVFSVDEDENIRQQYLQDPERFATSTRNCVRGWESKYKIFNNRIGSEISNMPLKQIIRGTPAFNIIEKHLPYFPIWKRLHTHLRTSPHYNMLYTDRLIRGVHETGQNIQSPGSTAPMTATQVEGKRKPLPSKRLQDNIKIGSSASNNSDETYEPSLFSGDSEDSNKISEVDSNDAKVESVRGGSKPEHHRSSRQKLEVLLTSKRIPKRKYEDTEGSGSGVLHSRRASSIDPFAPSPSNKERELKLAIELKRLENEALERKAAAAMRRLEFEVAAEDRRRQAEHNDKRAAEKHELMMKMVVVAGMAMGGQPTSIPP